MVNVSCIVHFTFRHILIFLLITLLQTCVYSVTAELPWNRTLEPTIGYEGNLRKKTTYHHADNSDEVKPNVLVGVMTPLILGILMTVMIILVMLVTCRRKRTGRYNTGTTEGTYLDEESETETPNGALALSSKPEASSDSDIEFTKL